MELNNTSRYIELCFRLNSACMVGCENTVDQLIELGADINNLYYHVTPLYTACKYGRTNIVKKLLSFGADINKISETSACIFFGNFHFTPFNIACRNRCKDIVDLLIKAGADINKVYNRKAIHLASDSLDIIKTLIRAGADIEATQGDGKSILHINCEKGNVDIIEFLIDAGVDCSVKDKLGHDPLWYLMDSSASDDEKIRLKALIDRSNG